MNGYKYIIQTRKEKCSIVEHFSLSQSQKNVLSKLVVTNVHKRVLKMSKSQNNLFDKSIF